MVRRRCHADCHLKNMEERVGKDCDSPKESQGAVFRRKVMDSE
jgi:hypothetical protein